MESRQLSTPSRKPELRPKMEHKLDQKRLQNGTENGSKNGTKNEPKMGPKIDPKMEPKMDPKMDPKMRPGRLLSLIARTRGRGPLGRFLYTTKCTRHGPRHFKKAVSKFAGFHFSQKSDSATEFPAVLVAARQNSTKSR